MLLKWMKQRIENGKELYFVCVLTYLKVTTKGSEQTTRSEHEFYIRAKSVATCSRGQDNSKLENWEKQSPANVLKSYESINNFRTKQWSKSNKIDHENFTVISLFWNRVKWTPEFYLWCFLCMELLECCCKTPVHVHWWNTNFSPLQWLYRSTHWHMKYLLIICKQRVRLWCIRIC